VVEVLLAFAILMWSIHSCGRRNTRPSRERFPKAESQQDGQFLGGTRHLLPLNHHQSAQSSRPANNTGNFAIGREYLQPHWGNSYGRGGNQATHGVNKFEMNTHNFSTPAPSQSYNRDQLWGNLQVLILLQSSCFLKIYGTSMWCAVLTDFRGWTFLSQT
jgi:hypothetical protein